MMIIIINEGIQYNIWSISEPVLESNAILASLWASQFDIQHARETDVMETVLID